jgi:preprotein translocase subunit SecG
MGILITILIIIVSLLLMGIVLIQNSKGGGLASGFSSSNQIVGVQKTTDFLEKGTFSISTTSATSAEPQRSEIEGMIDIQAPQGFDPAATPVE